MDPIEKVRKKEGEKKAVSCPDVVVLYPGGKDIGQKKEGQRYVQARGQLCICSGG